MRKLQHILVSGFALTVLLAVPLTSFAEGFEGLKMRMGSWDIQFSGNINAFVTDIDCDASGPGGGAQTVAGGLACGSAGFSRDANNIQTGLLPSWFGFHAETTNSANFYTGVTIGFQPGVDGGNQGDNPAGQGGSLDGAFGLNSENIRQVFVEFGNKEKWGTLKLGRDLGVFGSDAILSDMTLLGVGTVGDGQTGGGNTTLGRIGVGYVYADWKAQVQYNSPDWNGFKLTAALVDPWAAGGANSATAATGGQKSDTFGFEAKGVYSFDTGTFGGRVWASYINQDVDFTTPGFSSPDADGFDLGANVDIGPVNLVGYYYDGDGIGTTSFLLQGSDVTGKSRDSDGFYLQGKYTLPTYGTKLGLSFGESNLDDNAIDVGTNLLETNESWIVGVYHPATEALNLVLEYTQTESEAHNGFEAEEDVIALGAIMFF